MRLLASWCVLIVVGFLIVGCKGFFTDQSSAPGTTGFVYILNSAQGAGGVGSVSGYQAGVTNGALNTLLNSPFSVASQLSTPNSMSADLFGRFVFVSSNQGSGGINGFAISQNINTLGQLNSTGVTTTSAAPAAIAEAPSAAAVYAVESGTGGPQAEAFTVNPSTGALTAKTGSPFSLGASGTPTSVLVVGALLFVGMADGSILGVPINADGTLNVSKIVTTSPTATGISKVADLAVDGSGRLLYAVDGTQKVVGFAINAGTGALAAVANATAGSSPVSVAVASVNGTPTFAFTANQGGSVSIFLISNSGALTQVIGSPLAVSVITPIALAVDPSQAFLYLVGSGSTTPLSFVIVPSSIPPLVANTLPNPPAGTAPAAVVAVPSALH
jgi:6-phosphogluconolactonase (cycloisomerase 2 family)